jgi:hypothetical protein
LRRCGQRGRVQPSADHPEQNQPVNRVDASVPVYAVEQQKDRCSLKEDSAEKIADCDTLIIKKSASRLNELTRKNKGLIPD